MNSKIHLHVNEVGEVKVVKVSRLKDTRVFMQEGDVLINVSSFCGNNTSHKEARDMVENEAKKMHDALAHRWEALRMSFALFFPLNAHRLLRADLERVVGSLEGKFNDMIGKFDGIEPSTNFIFPASHENFSEIKNQTINFGLANKQDNVHFAYFLGNTRPDEQARSSLPCDVTCEFAWHMTTESPMDMDELKTWTDELVIFGLSLMTSGFDLLVYTTRGKPHAMEEGMPKQFRTLREKIKEKHGISNEHVWYIGLSNYGNKEYGATHTYEEARRLLQGTA
jgi:hypothetical protein